MFNTVLRFDAIWTKRKLSKPHIISAFLPLFVKIITASRNWTKFWQKQHFARFSEAWCITVYRRLNCRRGRALAGDTARPAGWMEASGLTLGRLPALADHQVASGRELCPSDIITARRLQWLSSSRFMQKHQLAAIARCIRSLYMKRRNQRRRSHTRQKRRQIFASRFMRANFCVSSKHHEVTGNTRIFLQICLVAIPKARSVCGPPTLPSWHAWIWCGGRWKCK